MELHEQASPVVVNAAFRLDGGFATPEAQQQFESAVQALGGLIGAEVTIDFRVPGEAEPLEAAAHEPQPSSTEASPPETPSDLTPEELREHYLDMSVEEVLRGFPEIDEKMRRAALRHLRGSTYKVNTVRDAIVMGRWRFKATTSDMRVAVRNAMQQFITDKLPGTTWREQPGVTDIAGVCSELSDVPAVAAMGDQFGNRRNMSGERLNMQDLSDMSVDDLTAFFSGWYWDDVCGETEEEREAAAEAVARVSAQAEGAEVRGRIQAFAIDFLHERQRIEQSWGVAPSLTGNTSDTNPAA